jgi:DNA-binding SARP family transcriptional activator
MRFGILGPFEVADDQGRGLALGGSKQRAVLAILLLHAGEAVSSDRLIDELWGERAPATAAKTIQVYVSHLRKVLGDGLLVTVHPAYPTDPLEIPARVRDLSRRLRRERIRVELLPGGELAHDMVQRLGDRQLRAIAQGPPGRQ